MMTAHTFLSRKTINEALISEVSLQGLPEQSAVFFFIPPKMSILVHSIGPVL